MLHHDLKPTLQLSKGVYAAHIVMTWHSSIQEVYCVGGLEGKIITEIVYTSENAFYPFRNSSSREETQANNILGCVEALR